MGLALSRVFAASQAAMSADKLRPDYVAEETFSRRQSVKCSLTQIKVLPAEQLLLSPPRV